MASGYGKHIEILTPKMGNIFQIGAPINISFRKPTGMGNVNIYYRLDINQEWNLITSDYAGTSFVWNTSSYTLNPTRTAQIKVAEYPDLMYEAISGFFILHSGTLVGLDYPYLLHGYGRPAYELYVNNQLAFEYEFPYPLALIEKWIPEIIVHKTFGGQKKYIAKGWWYNCLLDFSNYAKKDIFLGIYPILDFRAKYLTDARKIVLYPRGKVIETGGNINYFYEVEISENMELIMQHLFRQGYQKLKIEFNGIERLSQPFLDITLLNTQEMNKALPYGMESGYGTQYGEDYG